MELAEFVVTHKTTYLKDKQNFLYIKHCTIKNTTYWKCKNFRKESCTAKARTFMESENSQVERVITSGEHCHLSRIQEIKTIQAVAKALNVAKEQPTLQPRVVFGDITNNLDKEDTVLGVSKSALSRQIQRVRAKESKNPVSPKSFKDTITLMTEEIKKLTNGEMFLLYAGPVRDMDPDVPSGSWDDSWPEIEPCLLVFMSPFGKELLSTSANWFADGTFKTAPSPFSQIFTTMGELESGKVLPAVYSCLPNKDHTTYVKMWHIIHSSLPSIDHIQSFHIDLEIAIYNAFREVFGDLIQMNACYFHFRKCIREQLQKKGCIVEHNESESFQQLVSYMLTVVFVPVEDITKIWTEVIEPKFVEVEDELSEEAGEFYSYFENTYVGRQVRGRRQKSRYCPYFWNQFNNALKVLYSHSHCTVLYCTLLYCTVHYCIVLYCTILYCIVLYCNTL